jgi:hypothetical protein
MKLRIVSLLIAFGSLPAIAGAEVPALREGDILFTGCERGQGEAIIAATRSPYTHCGVVIVHEGKFMVLEAVQPVRISTLAAFIANGGKKHFVAKRLKMPVKPDAYRKAREWAAAQVGRDYDLRFGWDDERLYCSELVWKIYQKAGVELCAPKRFRDYDLGKPAVRKIIEERYGGMRRVPLDEKVVAPSDLAASELLVEVGKAGGD